MIIELISSCGSYRVNVHLPGFKMSFSGWLLHGVFLNALKSKCLQKDSGQYVIMRPKA